MQQNFSMKKIAAAVALTAGASLAGIQAAQADAIMFPYVVSSNTVTTVTSVVSHNTFGGALHYATWYKPAGMADSATAACQEGNWWRPTSPNDIVTFDVSPHYGATTGGVLFGDPGATVVTSNAYYGGAPFGSLSAVAPTRGFMLVADANNDSTVDGELYGEALVLEFASGAAWGYRAYNPARSGFPSAAGADAVAAVGNWQFSNGFETQGEVLGPVDLDDSDTVDSTAGVTEERELAPVEMYPLTEWVNRFFVTPIGTANQMAGNINTRVSLTGYNALTTFWAAFSDTVAFDRDENPVSGSTPANVACVGALDVANLVSTLGRTQIPNGGWTYAATSTGTIDAGAGTNAYVESDQAIIQQLRYNTAAHFNGEALTGTVNSAVWLRNNKGGLWSAINVGAGYESMGIQGF